MWQVGYSVLGFPFETHRYTSADWNPISVEHSQTVSDSNTDSNTHSLSSVWQDGGGVEPSCILTSIYTSILYIYTYIFMCVFKTDSIPIQIQVPIQTLIQNLLPLFSPLCVAGPRLCWTIVLPPTLTCCTCLCSTTYSLGVKDGHIRYVCLYYIDNYDHMYRCVCIYTWSLFIDN